MRTRPVIERVDVSVYRIPTDFPEEDGTFAWTATTMVVVHASAGGRTGVGYTYANPATASMIRDDLGPLVRAHDALNVTGAWDDMVHAIRNLGRPGVSSMAISATDTALWDLKARLLDVPLVSLFGSVRDTSPVYGSGGFTSYSNDQMRRQFEGWAEMGISRFKMKIGRDPAGDVLRVKAMREALGPGAEIFVDANGGYTRKQALAQAERFAGFGVTWFEEPVSSDDLEGLRLMRDRAPAGMDIAAGEYGYDLVYFRRMLEAGAVDVLQADATRCGGYSELLRVGALADAFQVPLSAHTAPSLHCHACCAIGRAVHIEYFHDHARIERMLFDGMPQVVRGELVPDLSRPGNGLELRTMDAEKYRI